MAVTTAKNAIDQTTNNVGVDTAKRNGLESINQMCNQRLLKRRQAKAEIDNVAQAKKAKSIETQMRQTKKSSSKSESR